MTEILLHLVGAFLMGFFLAVMDRTNEEVAFNKSKFRKLNPKWWVRSVSWQYVKFLPFTKYRPDAWHLAKSLMILSAAMLAAFKFHYTKYTWINIIIDASLITASFVLFYDYILKYRKK